MGNMGFLQQAVAQQAQQVPTSQQNGDEMAVAWEQMNQVYGAQMTQTIKQFHQVAKEQTLDKQTFAHFVQQYDEGNSVEFLGSACAALLTKTEKQLGVTIPMPVLLVVGISMIDDVAEVLAMTGRKAYSKDEMQKAIDIMTQAWLGMNQERAQSEEMREVMGGQLPQQQA